MIPTEKPGYFSFILVGNGMDLERMLTDPEEVRQALRKRVERTDLVWGELEAVSHYK